MADAHKEDDDEEAKCGEDATKDKDIGSDGVTKEATKDGDEENTGLRPHSDHLFNGCHKWAKYIAKSSGGQRWMRGTWGDGWGGSGDGVGWII